MSRMQGCLLAVVAGVFVLAGTGCTDAKAKAQQAALTKQNKQYADQLAADQAQMDDMKRQVQDARMAAINTPPTTPTSPTGTPDLPPDMTAADATAMPTSAELAGSGITISKSRAGENQLELSGDVLFDSGKSVLKPAAKKTLDKAIAIIKAKYAGKTLRIEGHTDSTPFKASSHMTNEILGQRRAEAVVAYLSAHGISAKHLTAVSLADTQPKSKTNLALNRRVAIVVTR